ncbi:ribokinase [Stutzerimonas nosocomialis]|uniref:Ribokinase n=1 Tax=Stutzerimonas nosocomialis TaxID=1056496 RepID=A0A5R9QC04_9GAMM|nr:PfkB family carbohydrate kinase [Stutzerimonas nosocomialis]TLX62332.1 ribokinase [Stutzerimonas nosocomialis]
MNAPPRPTLLSLGSINADFQVRVDQPPGSEETLLAHDFCRLAGGKASNTAWLGATLGHRSLLLGRVGDDELAEQALGSLREAGVDVSGVTVAEGKPTAVSMIMVPPDGKKHIVLATNANDCWDEPAIDAMVRLIERTESPACLVVDCEVPAAVVLPAVEAATGKDIPVVLDPSFPDRVPDELLSRLQAVTPNTSEARALTGREIQGLHDAAWATRQLRDRGVRIACIKLGDGGCVLDAGEGAIHVPPGEVQATDSTGAGDAFTGVFAIALLEGREPLEAAAWGVAAANLAVTAYGSKPAYPDRQQVSSMAARLLRDARCLDEAR